MRKSTYEDGDSCRLLAFGPFEEVPIKMKTIKDLVSKLPQGMGEHSTTYYSYVVQSNYER